MANAVEFRNVRFAYGDRVALRDVNLTVPEGAMFGLIGPNGAGKSTALNLLTTLLPLCDGTIQVCGRDVQREPDATRRCIGYAPEQPLLYSGLTALEFAELSAALHGADPAEARRTALSLFARMGLAERADDPIASYSKGMRRKTLLVSALVHRPRVVVLDEPLEGLDVISQSALRELLAERVRAGATVVYSTHIMEVIDRVCTHVAILRAGVVLAQGEVGAVRAQLGVEHLADAFGAARAEEAAR